MKTNRMKRLLNMTEKGSLKMFDSILAAAYAVRDAQAEAYKGITHFKSFHSEVGDWRRIGGNTMNAIVHISLIAVNEAYQTLARTHAVRRAPLLDKIADNWDWNHYQPILLSPHRESAIFPVIDGYGRTKAALDAGIEWLPAVLLLDGMEMSIEDRAVWESKIFLEIQGVTTPLTKSHTIGALILQGNSAAIELSRYMHKWDLRFCETSGFAARGYLGGVEKCLAIVARRKREGYLSGAEQLDYALSTLYQAGYFGERFGLAQRNVQALCDLFAKYPSDVCGEVSGIMATYLQHRSPSTIKDDANAMFPRRGGKDSIGTIVMAWTEIIDCFGSSAVSASTVDREDPRIKEVLEDVWNRMGENDIANLARRIETRVAPPTSMQIISNAA